MMRTFPAAGHVSYERAHLSPTDLPVRLDPPRSGSGLATEGQARLRVSVHRSSFLDHETPTVTDGLEPEEPVCWACLGRGGRTIRLPSAIDGSAVSSGRSPRSRAPPPEA